MNPSLRNWTSWLIGGVLLCAVGFQNEFPLIYPDTGTYIECGFRGEQWVYGRSMAYALFIRHASLAESLWYVMLAQGLLLSSAMLLTLRHFLPRRVRPHADLIHLGLILLLVLCSGISVRTSQLMPDIFTPMAAMGMMLVLFAPGLSRLEGIYLSLLTVWSLMSHPSNLASFLLLLGGLSLWWSWQWWRTRQWAIVPRRWLWGALLLGAAWLLVPTLNYAHGAHFRVTESSPIFFMGKLNYLGILPLFLERECETDSSYLFCEYRGQIPYQFLWDRRSPMAKMGGWQAADPAAYRELTSTILSKPRYLKLYLEGVLVGTVKQFFNFQTANLDAGKRHGTPYVHKRFYHEERILKASKQWNDRLDLSDLQRREPWLIYASLFVVLVLWFRPSWRPYLSAEATWVLVFVVGLLLTNAAVCGGLSNGTMRYQNRLVWLLPFVLGMLGGGVALDLWHQVRSWLTTRGASHP